jgi:hypothetical protein
MKINEDISDDEFFMRISSLKRVRENAFNKPLMVCRGNIEALKGLTNAEMGRTVDHIKKLPTEAKLDALRRIVDNCPYSDINHPNCKKIFYTFKSELNNI